MIRNDAWTRTLVSGWRPEAVASGSQAGLDFAEELDFELRSTASILAGLGVSGGWAGQAFDAAQSHVDDIRQDATIASAAMRAACREIQVGADAVELCRAAVLRAVSLAEVDGCEVGDDWSVLAVDGRPGRATLHAESIGTRLGELHNADRDAANAVVRALKPLARSGGPRNFLPLVIGAGLLLEMAIDALIAAGVISVGALAFALIDQFGEGAWDAIQDAIPDQFFTDAGPVDQGGIEGVLDADTQPGRNSPNRQVATDQDVKDLYETLSKEGRPMDVNRYPGVGVALPDGTEIRMRDSSTSGGATLDIKFPDGRKVVKVHVE